MNETKLVTIPNIQPHKTKRPSIKLNHCHYTTTWHTSFTALIFLTLIRTQCEYISERHPHCSISTVSWAGYFQFRLNRNENERRQQCITSSSYCITHYSLCLAVGSFLSRCLTCIPSLLPSATCIFSTASPSWHPSSFSLLFLHRSALILRSHSKKGIRDSSAKLSARNSNVEFATIVILLPTAPNHVKNAQNLNVKILKRPFIQRKKVPKETALGLIT